ncbi:hypothetical protein LEQ04_01930 [Riemerella anatipestifer]|nr:hypothetical protein LEQ04_01930 [Riemerella anatipestifer]
MKYFNLLILTFLFSCNANKSETSSRVASHGNVENTIRELVNYRKEDLAIIIYEDDQKNEGKIWIKKPKGIVGYFTIQIGL